MIYSNQKVSRLSKERQERFIDKIAENYFLDEFTPGAAGAIVGSALGATPNDPGSVPSSGSNSSKTPVIDAKKAISKAKINPTAKVHKIAGKNSLNTKNMRQNKIDRPESPTAVAESADSIEKEFEIK